MAMKRKKSSDIKAQRSARQPGITTSARQTANDDREIVALTLKPDQTKGFGLYLVSAMIVLLSTGVAHMIAIAVLHEKILR